MGDSVLRDRGAKVVRRAETLTPESRGRILSPGIKGIAEGSHGRIPEAR